MAEYCVICKNVFARDPSIEVPAAAVPACNAECTKEYDIIVRRHIGAENNDDQLPTTSRGRNGRATIILRVSVSPSGSEASAPAASPRTPREQASVPKTTPQASMSSIREDGPPSPEVVQQERPPE